MNNESSHNEDHPEIRKLLKSLPKKTASGDFEMRLQQRINEGTSAVPEGGFSEKEFSPFRIPTFAFSLMTLLVVGTISYYAFFRDTDIPRLPEKEIPVLNDREPTQSSSDKVVVPEQTKPDEKIEEPSKDAAVTIQKSQSTDEVSAPLNQKAEEKPMMQYRAAPQKTDPVHVESEENLREEAPRLEVGLPPVQMAAPAAEDVKKDEAIILPEKQENQGYRSIVSPAGKATAPLLNDLKKMSSTTKFGEYLEIDSSKIRDSIKADSLQKLLKLRRKDQKIRKPFN